MVLTFETSLVMQIKFTLPLSILREADRFVAYSPALDLSTSGKTYEEVKRRFREAVQLFFEETTRHGTLEDALAELGWSRADGQWAAPILVGQEAEQVAVAV